jgi:hypothetical protein
MRLISRSISTSGLLGLVTLVFLLNLSGGGIAYGQSPWDGYTPTEKQMAIAGFTDCYRSQSSNKNAFVDTDLISAIRVIDESAKANGLPFANVILRSLEKSPLTKPDPHGERWDGPTGFHTGLWWRGVENSERQAYIQGIVWCIQAPGVSARMMNASSEAIVMKLNDWYVVTDDDWKDPRSKARVDISVIAALQKIEILCFKGLTKNK